ncbi:MAG: XrtA/PEP-CTERM system exopolysaccharide export protein [Pseudomonadota bacterium]
MNTLHTQSVSWLKTCGLTILIFLFGAYTANAQTLPPAKPASTFAFDYLIGPGDNLNVVVWRNPEVSLTVPVRPDGKITTPLVEDLQASGKTSSQLARDIEKALAKFIQQPIVTVIVTSFMGTNSEQIRVIGQAAKPQALPYRQDMSLLDVMIAVGGMTEFAAGNKASIIRNVNGQQQKLPIRLNDLIKDGDISVNMLVRPGDILLIPESFF